MAEENGQKTEQPTGKKLSEAHDRGQYAKAPEIQIFATMAAILVVLSFTVEASSKYVAIFTTEIFTQFTRLSLNSETAVSQMASLLITAGIVVGPVILACTLAAVVAGGLQSGFRISYKAVGLNFDKLNIAEGFQRLFSTKIFVNVGLDSLKVIAVGTTFYIGARKLMADPLFSVPIETAYLAYFLRTAATTFFGRLLLAIGVIGAINYFYERFRTNKDLMMTKQEVKDETKGAELDGKIKMAQRRLARRLLQKQMLEAVQTADVVITNPTHYAIALKYERGRDQAPVILAKGENRFAFRIKELAAEHGVPMVENKPVARLLFSIGKVGSAIPSELYQAVAQILAVVYKTHRYYFYRLKSRRLEMAA